MPGTDERRPAVQLAVKRALDVAGSAVLVTALSPLMLVVGAAVRIDSKGGAIFRQQRVGRGGRPFTILKFRTMVEEADRSALGTYCYRDDPRITRAGRLLRRTSLDELPQLVNVLMGDMSFVGPRPDLPHHVARYDARQRGRLAMRPGITGWAQVNGRNGIPWAERIELDLAYVEGWSLWRDLRVAARTVWVVLAREGTELPRSVGEPPWPEQKRDAS
jgi:lipopolysaccharide/colanic/teichoic acid biosynthesis glycosyltransferase